MYGSKARHTREKAQDSILELRNHFDNSHKVASHSKSQKVCKRSTPLTRGRPTSSPPRKVSARQRLDGMIRKAEFEVDMHRPARVHFDLDDDSSFNVDQTDTHIKQSYSSLPSGIIPHVYDPSTPRPGEIQQLSDMQKTYITELRKENFEYQQQLANLKIKVAEVIEENKSLHEQLTSTIRDAVVNPDETWRKEIDGTKPKAEFVRWKQELERLNSLHTAKTGRLESQLLYTKDQLSKTETTINELRSKLRIHEASGLSLGGAVSHGLCVMCAREEAVIPSVNERQNHRINELTKEQDDLVSNMASFKARMEELKIEEEEAYRQVKQSVLLTEQAQMEKTQAHIEKEQAKEDLERMKLRYDELMKDIDRQLNDTRNASRLGFKHEIEELHDKLKEMSKSLGEAEHQCEKIAREKQSLEKESERMKNQLLESDREYSRINEDMRDRMTRADLSCNKAKQDMNRINSEYESLRRERDQEKKQGQTELDDVKRRLRAAENELVDSKEQCITLEGNNQKLQKQIHLFKIDKENKEKEHKNITASMNKNIQARTHENKQKTTNLENENLKLNEILLQHRDLVEKLRTENRNISSNMEKIQNKNQEKKLKIKELNTQLEMYSNRLQEAEENSQEHVQIQTEMQRQLAQRSSQSEQIMELLRAQDGLMKERKVLQREVDFLRHQLNSRDTDYGIST